MNLEIAALTPTSWIAPRVDFIDLLLCKINFILLFNVVKLQEIKREELQDI